MKFKLPLIATALVSVMSLGWVFSTSLADEGMAQAGRYQQTAVFRQEGLDRIYVTIIDTTTGKVVRLDRFDTGDYETADPPK